MLAAFCLPDGQWPPGQVSVALGRSGESIPEVGESASEWGGVVQTQERLGIAEQTFPHITWQNA